MSTVFKDTVSRDGIIINSISAVPSLLRASPDSSSANCSSSKVFSVQHAHQGPLHCLYSIALRRKLKIHISQICVTINDHLNVQIGTPGIFHLPFVCWAGSGRALLRASLWVGFAGGCD